MEENFLSVNYFFKKKFFYFQDENFRLKKIEAKSDHENAMFFPVKQLVNFCSKFCSLMDPTNFVNNFQFQCIFFVNRNLHANLKELVEALI